MRALSASRIGAPSRLLQCVRFAQAGIPVPATRYLSPRLLAGSYSDLADQFGLPFILAALRGGTGRRNLLVRDEPSFDGLLRAARSAYFLAREFIPAEATYRLLVLEHQVSVVMRQGISFGESFLPGIPEEGEISLIDSATLSPNAGMLAVQAASLMGLDIAEVRMVRHLMTGEWYVLDTNATPPFSTGAFV
jgi:glutathione synthase/RimK-type ligase-like ATP-grasp enzyme